MPVSWKRRRGTRGSGYGIGGLEGAPAPTWQGYVKPSSSVGCVVLDESFNQVEGPLRLWRYFTEQRLYN